ncbi:Lrp/AsnC family transcriptional regulator [Streptomyces mirabilis]
MRIIRALQIAPRASFASTAVALGLTEGAVNRRYRRLRADGIIRVIGVVNPGALRQSRWLVRLRCRPGSVVAIADALAKRDDVNWVALSTAGCEITSATQSRTQEQREDLLGQRLPRTAAVLDINAFAVLRQFMGGRGHYWAALQGALSPEQEAMLGDTLAADARASLVDLAATALGTNSPPGTAWWGWAALMVSGSGPVSTRRCSAGAATTRTPPTPSATGSAPPPAGPLPPHRAGGGRSRR